MASHLDLEEQEQLAQIKHFWNSYGNLISWLLIVVLGCYAAWNGWQYWQRHQATQAAALFDEVERAVAAEDRARIERAVTDMKDKFGGTRFAQQAALLAARSLALQGQTQAAMPWLQWVADQAADPGLRDLARIRLAALQWENNEPDVALKTLQADFSEDMRALAADLRGDVLQAKGQSAQAVVAYRQAAQGLDQGDYARVVQAKLAALGAEAGEAKP